MSGRADRVQRRRAEQTDAIPEVRPWCEAGWIFRDGEAQPIERQHDHAKPRRARRHDERDE
jgi:hypothetical protein